LEIFLWGDSAVPVEVTLGIDAARMLEIPLVVDIISSETMIRSKGNIA
jgi:hypothetical protein